MSCGDCLSCQRLAVCSATNVRRVQDSYTCEFFVGAPEPVYLARLESIRKFGEAAVEAMLTRPPVVEEQT